MQDRNKIHRGDVEKNKTKSKPEDTEVTEHTEG
jgi:hypothetical protein